LTTLSHLSSMSIESYDVTIRVTVYSNPNRTTSHLHAHPLGRSLRKGYRPKAISSDPTTPVVATETPRLTTESPLNDMDDEDGNPAVTPPGGDESTAAMQELWSWVRSMGGSSPKVKSAATAARTMVTSTHLHGTIHRKPYTPSTVKCQTLNPKTLNPFYPQILNSKPRTLPTNPEP